MRAPLTLRHWFAVTREWVRRRDALLRADEDRMIRAARDRASGDERAFLDALLDIRARNARSVAPSAETTGMDRS